MRLFYDETGRVVGSVEGALPEIEQGFGLPSNAVGETQPDRELYLRLVDPKDPLHPHMLQVTNPTKNPQTK